MERSSTFYFYNNFRMLLIYCFLLNMIRKYIWLHEWHVLVCSLWKLFKTAKIRSSDYLVWFVSFMNPTHVLINLQPWLLWVYSLCCPWSLVLDKIILPDQYRKCMHTNLQSSNTIFSSNYLYFYNIILLV